MIRFGILGAADIAPRALVWPCTDEPGAHIRCVAARNIERARGFARWQGIPRVYATYEEVIADPKVDAVYVPLPIALHCEWVLAALAAGKHVLCEKSFASNADEAQKMTEAAEAAGLVLMDAFHYRYHPLFHRAVALLRSGAIGRVESIDAAFHIPVVDREGIRHNYAMGGGVTMDIGCYPISWVRHLTGEEPDSVTATAEVENALIDVALRAEMRFPSGAVARTSGDMREGTSIRMDFAVRGTEGTLRVVNPLVPQSGHELRTEIDGQTNVERFDRRSTYGYQLDAFLAAVNDGAPVITDGREATAQMRVIDRCYESAGLPRRGEVVT